MIIDDSIQVVRQGDVVQINEEQKHAIKAIKELEIIEVQQGINLIEADVHRIQDDWELMEENCFSKAEVSI